MTTIRPQFVLLAAVLALSLVAGSALAAVTHDDSPAKRADVTGVVPSTVAQSFGVLRKEPVQPNGLTLKQVELLSKTTGLAVELAQPISGAQTKADLWVAPSADGVCLLMLSPGAYGPGGSCSRGDDPLGGQRMTYVIYADDDIDVAGLVHDGVSSVQLTLASGERLELPVEDNVWSTNVSSEPAEVQFELPNGTTVTDKSR